MSSDDEAYIQFALPQIEEYEKYKPIIIKKKEFKYKKSEADILNT